MSYIHRLLPKAAEHSVGQYRKQILYFIGIWDWGWD
jgi:hypothetical protein